MLRRCWILLLMAFFFGLNSGFGNTSDWQDSLESGLREHYLGHFADAETFLRAAVEGARLHGTESQRAGTLGCLGDLYLSEDRFADAEDVYSEALSLYRISEKKTGTVDSETVLTLRGLGAAYAFEGETKKALSILNDAWRQAKKNFSSDARLSATVMNSLGLAYTQASDFKKAEQLFLSILQIQPETGVTV